VELQCHGHTAGTSRDRCRFHDRGQVRTLTRLCRSGSPELRLYSLPQ
jgi:hypothetical protein